MPQYSGVWTLADAARLQSTQQWVTDPNFKNTTLLLQADTINAATQNNTFLDSSSNGFSITRNGNTTQGTFTPFSQSAGWWSVYADTAYQGFSGSASLIGASVTTFTAEAWVYLTAAPASADGVPCMIGMDALPASSIYLGFGPNASQKLVLRWFDGASKTATGSTTLALNTWYHVAVVANANALTMYVNGVPEVLTGTTTLTNRNGTASAFSLLQNSSASAYQFKGYVSNIRVSTVARYTTSFTPSPIAFTSDANTVLLTCQSNRFVDNSNSPQTLTIVSTPSVQAFSPFAPQYQYDPTVTGGSGYFDGTGDYLLTASNAAMGVGASDFTIEFWLYPTSFAATQNPLWSALNGSKADVLTFEITTAGVLNAYVTQSGGAAWSIISAGNMGTLRLNAWNHVALTRSGSSWRGFVNGVQGLTVTSSATVASFNGFIVSGYISAGFYTGYISGLREVVGTAVYTAAFTPPTTPPTAITNTQLLLNFTNAGIYDGTLKNNLETVGNAQVSTTVVKYGSGSMYFDGNGDNLAAPVNNDLNFGTGDFTVECWVNTTTRTLNYPLIVGNNNGSFSAGAIALTNSNFDNAAYYDRFVLSVFDIAGAGSAPALVAGVPNALNTWYHLAIVRNNTSLVMYRDGVAVASRTISAAIVFNWGKLGLRVGGGNWDGANSWFNGYIDDLRITKGLARYTQNFIPPSVALPRQ